MMIDIKNTLSVREKSILRYALSFLLANLPYETPYLLDRGGIDDPEPATEEEVEQVGAEIEALDLRLATGLNEREMR